MIDKVILHKEGKNNRFGNGELMSKYDLVQERQYKVKPLDRHMPVTNRIEAYRSFIDNWDTLGLKSVKEFKTLVLDENDRPIYIVSFEPFEEITKAHITKIFQIVKDLQDAKSVIVGQNSPEKSVVPDKQETLLAKTFQTVADKYAIPLIKQLILSNNGLYELDTNVPPKTKQRLSHA